ncbi:MAG TPA: hypothetical protein VGW80_08885 [Solirubrobacterales bacterium]|jgi:hypothetical protein|nr:hypothetical protein [Solirubrobacterales bacterium]
MKLKILSLAVIAALALTLSVAGTASGATFAITGVTQNNAITVTKSLATGTSIVISDTSGSFANTCTASHLHGTTQSPYSSSFIFIPLTTVSFSQCSEEPVVVDTAGSLSVANISGTRNGTVRSIGMKLTTPSPFGSLTCTTAASPGTDIGTLTGVSSGNAKLDVNAVLNCGFFLPSAKLTGSYITTSPHALSVHP